jgi:hypothetical protein
LAAIVIVASNVFTGRTGLIFGALFLSALVFSLVFAAVKKGFSAAPKLVLLCVFLFLFANAVLGFDLDAEARDWAFEWLEGLATGHLRSESSDELGTMLFLPTQAHHLLFGIGFFEGDSTLYPRSDSGYVKTIFSVGLIFGAMLYFGIGRMFWHVSRVPGGSRLLVICVLLFMFIVEIKEPFLYQNYAARVICLLSGGAIFVKQALRRRAAILASNSADSARNLVYCESFPSR